LFDIKVRLKVDNEGRINIETAFPINTRNPEGICQGSYQLRHQICKAPEGCPKELTELLIRPDKKECSTPKFKKLYQKFCNSFGK
jgi:hypothetical protein